VPRGVRPIQTKAHLVLGEDGAHTLHAVAVHFASNVVKHDLMKRREALEGEQESVGSAIRSKLHAEAHPQDLRAQNVEYSGHQLRVLGKRLAAPVGSIH